MDACSNLVDAKIDELTVLNCMDVFIASVDHCRKKRVLPRISCEKNHQQKVPLMMDLQEPLIFGSKNLYMPVYLIYTLW